MFVIFLLTGTVGINNLCYSQTSISGNLQNYNAFQTTGDLLLITGRNRLHVDANHSLSRGNLVISGDLIHRYAMANQGEISRTEIFFRNAYADIYFDNADIRAGYQSIPMGRSFGAYVTDILTPLDLREFPTFEPSVLQMGLAALNVTYYFGNNYFQFILSPGFQPNRIPDTSSRWFPLPETPDFIPINYKQEESTESLKNLNAAIRFAWRSSLSFDLDLMVYHWSHPVPAYRIFLNTSISNEFGSVDLVESYRNSFMPGYSLAWRFSEGFELQSDGLFVYRRLFTYLPVSVCDLEQAMENPLFGFQLLPEFIPADDGFVLERPWAHGMIGLQYQTGEWTFLTQGFLEYIFNYDNKTLSQRYFPYATGAVQKRYYRDRLNSSLFGRYNILTNDFWIRADTEFEWRDDIFISTGLNLFGGPDISTFYGHVTFNRFRHNSFTYLRLKIYF